MIAELDETQELLGLQMFDHLGGEQSSERAILQRIQVSDSLTLIHRETPGAFVELHPDDAARLGLVDASPVRVRSDVGEVVLPAEVTDAVMPGVVSIPHGWGHDAAGAEMRVAAKRPGVNSNLLADTGRVDPLSGNAVLSGIPVELAPA